MIVTHIDIKEKIRLFWPHLRDIWLMDKKYWCPSKDDLEKTLQETVTRRTVYLDSVWDCDDFALQLHAEIGRLRTVSLRHKAVDRSEWKPWAFGQALLLKVRGKKTNHAINICMTTSGLVFIEPQTNKVWIADPHQDELYFCRM